MKVVFVSVEIYLGEVQLRSVPAADAIICPKISLNGVIIGFSLVPFWQQEHVFAVLMGKPGDWHFGLQCFIMSRNFKL